MNNRLSGYMNEEYDPIAELVAEWTDQILEADGCQEEIGNIVYAIYMNTFEEARKSTLKSVVTSLTGAI